MMGRNHAVFGLCCFGVSIPAANHFYDLNLEYLQLVGALIVALGGAVAPDIDHPDSKVSRAMGFATTFTARIVRRLSGGHRQLTHSITAAVFVIFGSMALTRWWNIQHPDFPINKGVVASFEWYRDNGFSGSDFALAAVNFIVVGVALTMITMALRSWWYAWQTALVTLLFTVVSVGTGIGRWYSFALGVGYVSHLIGDGITREGIPLFKPFSSKKYHLIPKRFCFRTGGYNENIVVGACVLATVSWWMWRATSIRPVDTTAILRPLLGL